MVKVMQFMPPWANAWYSIGRLSMAASRAVVSHFLPLAMAGSPALHVPYSTTLKDADFTSKRLSARTPARVAGSTLM